MSTHFLEVPKKTILSTINVADHCGTLISPRHEEFRETVENYNICWHECLAQLIKISPARFVAIKSGLASGVYLLPVEGEAGYFIHSCDKPIRPIVEIEKIEFCLSYSSEERILVLDIKKDLEEKGISCFLIDVAEDPDDAIWFLRFKTAMAFSTYFIPILSKYYLSRSGSTLEFEEAWASVETQESFTNWYPIIPLLTNSFTKLKDPTANRIVLSLPGFKIDTETNYDKTIRFIESLSCYNKGIYNKFESFLALVAMKEIHSEINNKKCTTYIFSSDLCFHNKVIKCDNNSIRIIKKKWIKENKKIPTPKSVDIDVELKVASLIREKKYYEAVCYTSKKIQQEGADVSRYISLAKALELGGYESYALICFKRARKALNSGHTDSTIKLVNDSINRITEMQPSNLNESIQDVLENFSAQQKIGTPSKINLKKSVVSNFEKNWETINGIKYFFSLASDYCNENNLDKAEAIMVAAFYYTVSDDNRSRSLYMAAKVTLSQGKVDRAIKYLSIGLDYQPNHEGIKALLQDCLEQKNSRGTFLLSS